MRIEWMCKVQVRTEADLVGFWCSLEGQSANAQQSAILLHGITEAELDVLDMEASGARVDTAHSEWPRGSYTYCSACGIVEGDAGCDLYWHPWVATVAD